MSKFANSLQKLWSFSNLFEICQLLDLFENLFKICQYQFFQYQIEDKSLLLKLRSITFPSYETWFFGKRWHWLALKTGCCYQIEIEISIGGLN